MLLRFIAKNFLSFNNETEFNLFPGSRTTHLNEHKISVNHATALRMSGIYGANGAGKSNLIKAISTLQKIVLKGYIRKDPILFKRSTFRLHIQKDNEPISFAIEFYNAPNIYYYTISLNEDSILNEELYISEANEDVLVFKRDTQNGQNHIQFSDNYMSSEKNITFKEVLEEKLLRPDMLLLTFMAINYPEERKAMSKAYDWFAQRLEIVHPDASVNTIAHLLDTNKKMLNLLNQILPAPHLHLF